MNSPWEQRYWSLDLPGLTKEQANAVLEVVRGWPGIIGATAVDPDEWLTQHMDRETVEVIARIVACAVTGAQLTTDDARDAAGLLDDYRSWLESAPDH